jgi:hypothetical protein
VAGHVRDGPPKSLRVAALSHSRHVEKVAGRIFHVPPHEGVVVVQHAPPDVGPEAPDHPEINESNLEVLGPIAGQNLQVARVQIGVEESVFVQHPDDRRGAEIDYTLPLGLTQLAHGLRTGPHAAQVLHREHITRAQCTMNVREDHPWDILKVRGEDFSVVCFVVEVNFALRVGPELFDDLCRLVARQQPLQKYPEKLQKLQVGRHNVPDARLNHLHDNVFPVVCRGTVHLCDGRGGQRLRIDRSEEGLHGILQFPFNNCLHLREGNGRQVVHQAIEFLRNHLRKQILSDGHDLPQLGERGAEDFQSAPQLLREGTISEVATDEGLQDAR